MKNKGFTLVELLAVIVVLAVISLISVPMILGVVEEAKKSSFKDSVLSAFDAVEYYVIDNDLGDVPENGIAANLLKMKNNNFESGRFIKNIDGNLIAEFVSDGKYCATGPLTNLNISKGECEISAPSVAVEVNGKESTITIIDENGIVAYAVTTNSEEPEEWTDIEETTRLEQNLTADSPGTYYIHVRNKYGKKITKEYVVEESAFCAYELGTEWVFDYTGGEQEFVIPCSGTYKLETWGASGGGWDETFHGGYGGYSTGNINVRTNEKIYVNVGGKGTQLGGIVTGSGGYNGGGSVLNTWSDGNEQRTTGGGATHIATRSGELFSLEDYKGEYIENKKIYDSNVILIVSGGGGGAGVNAAILGSAWAIGGSGGGFIGGAGSGINYQTVCNSTGGSQFDGGTSNVNQTVGSFGNGGICNVDPASGGGGGFYGGACSLRGASGGSGYIASSNLTNKSMYCYDCGESQEEATKTISTTGENADRDSCPNGYSSDPISNCAKSGNGYAKITYIGY